MVEQLYRDRTQPTIRRTWEDFQRAQGFNTFTAFRGNRAEGQKFYASIECFEGVPYTVSGLGATEAEARAEATRKANERWPATP